ncbi:MAG: AraC family transcriptional regulator [Gammaproteobacteria bacterium]|jgi:AraC-like DNA-binding protein|nr:AraC family transcriptional regulator [Gammaproteobacteria bacterium]
MTALPMAPAAVFSSATTTLDKLGFSSERIVERAGLPQYQFLEPHHKIPGMHLYRLYADAARALGEEALGAMVPTALPITHVGRFGKAITESPTVHSAIDTMNRLYAMASNVHRYRTTVDGHGVWWLRYSALPSCAGARQMELASLSYMVQTVRASAGCDWRPARMCVERDSIPRLNQLEPFAGAEVLRERGVSGIAITWSILSQLNPLLALSDPIEGDRFFADAPSEELPSALRQVLRAMVHLGHPRIETIAEIAGVQVRTLQRRLRAEGLSFKTLVDQARFLETMDLVGDQDVTFTEISHHLGYTDQAHFTRAFRRWAGVTPSRYRSELLRN